MGGNGSNAIDKFNKTCEYVRYSDDFAPTFTRNLYKVLTFAVDVAAEIAIEGVSLTMNCVGYLTSESKEDWERKKLDATEYLIGKVDNTIKFLNDHDINTQFVGNMIQIASLVPSLRGIGKTARNLYKAHQIQKASFQMCQDSIAKLNNQLAQRTTFLDKQLISDISNIYGNNAQSVLKTNSALTRNTKRMQTAQNKNKRGKRRAQNEYYKESAQSTMDFLKEQCIVDFDDWKTRLRDCYSKIGEYLARPTEENIRERKEDDETIADLKKKVEKLSDEQIKDLLKNYAQQLRRDGQNELADQIEKIINPIQINLKGCVGCFFGDDGSVVPFDFTK
ncbi:hypothetical protein M9Y10_016711 [Tritrichomonas musculus]|uniref:Uncharacterized protein n=1 Tax=Tritrichomonas musculus TaxID=1915356 RepID=A0ABR2HWX7_9EUKA